MDGLLRKATAPDDAAPPGYVFVELCKLTNNDIAVCERMADWLGDKVKTTKAPPVLWKLLLTIKQVARGGRPEFKRQMQRHKEAIKACADFRGPPDPLRGNEPYKKVQDASREALEAIFDASGPAPTAGTRISGISGGGGGIPPPLAGGGGGGGRPGGPLPYGVGGGGGAGGMSTALPGQPGYDPNSPMHAPPSSTGTMQGFGNYDPTKVRGIRGKT